MTESREMPRYKCHKEVHALQIARIGLDKDHPDGAVITPVEEGYGPFSVDGDYLTKHRPAVGGYYVVYADGYASYSPAKAFEEGYTRMAREFNRPKTSEPDSKPPESEA